MRALALLALLALTVPAKAETLAEWFKSLRQPVTNMGCCDESDCKPTQARYVDGGWQAMYRGSWVNVPPEKVIEDKGHPAGAAVLCAVPSSIYCFVPPGAGG